MRVDETMEARHMLALGTGMRAAGLDLVALCREAGLDGRFDDLASNPLEPDLFEKLWIAAIRVSGDPSIPARVGWCVPLGTYRVIDYLGWACPHVGAAFVQLARYFRLVTPELLWSVDESGGEAVVTLESNHPSVGERDAQLQYTLGVTFNRFQQATLDSFVPLRLELAMGAPPDGRIHREVFRCPIDYGRPRTAVVVSREMWRLGLAGAAPDLREVLERHAADLLARQDDGDALARVRAAIRQELPQRPPKLEAIAARVAMSTRTLQRRLGDAATTFQALVEDERRQAACAYLRRGDLAVGDVAYMLGYSEPSAFARAFKRWTGCSPREYRATPA